MNRIVVSLEAENDLPLSFPLLTKTTCLQIWKAITPLVRINLPPPRSGIAQLVSEDNIESRSEHNFHDIYGRFSLTSTTPLSLRITTTTTTSPVQHGTNKRNSRLSPQCRVKPFWQCRKTRCCKRPESIRRDQEADKQD
jgi:hypothetical protein